MVVAGLAAGAVALWRSRKTTPSASSTTSTSTSTTIATEPAPLTGVYLSPSAAAFHRPALTVKIENTPQALPQWGIAQADVVYEEIVNGGITRLAAVFNSQAPAKIGPVRSVRPTDTQVVYPLGGIFAFSGGAAYAIDSIETAPVTLVDEDAADPVGAMFRDPDLYAPHNLFGVGPKLFTFKGSPVPPPSLFQYVTTSTSGHATKIPGTIVSRVVVPFPSIYAVTWTWDEATGSWDRTLFGQPDVTGTGQRESPKNVIVMYVDYVNGIGTENSYANLQGSGQADFFYRGREVTGTWSRGPSKSDVIQYTMSNGQPMHFTRGQTWVELLNDGATLTVTH